MKLAPARFVLVAVAAGFLALDYHLLTVPIDTAPLPPASGAKDAGIPNIVADRPWLADQAVGILPQTASRPLFWRSRRPIALPVSTADIAEPAVGDQITAVAELRLAGIIQIGATSRRALIVWSQQPAGRWLEEGAEVNGWQVVSIESSGVRILLGSQFQQLELN